MGVAALIKSTPRLFCVCGLGFAASLIDNRQTPSILHTVATKCRSQSTTVLCSSSCRHKSSSIPRAVPRSDITVSPPKHNFLSNRAAMSPELAPSVRCRLFNRKRARVAVCSPDHTRSTPELETLSVPHFWHDNAVHVLVKDLASLWNFPSSYQVVAHLRRSGVPKTELVSITDRALNAQLFAKGLILECDSATTLLYIELLRLVSILADTSVLLLCFRLDEFPLGIVPDKTLEKLVPSISHVFPDYGEVAKTVSLSHASFLALDPLTKLLVSKHAGTYREHYGTALTVTERELLLRENNYSLYEPAQDGVDVSTDPLKIKKIPGEQSVANLDPNLLDVTKNILPACGLIPKFNVASLCRVPTYYVTTNHMEIKQQNPLQNPADRHLKDLRLTFDDPGTAPNQINLLVPVVNQEPFLYKDYYYKHHRGLGTGVYKDAALTSMINKIRTVDDPPGTRRPSHLPAYRVMKREPRSKQPLKGLLHPYYSKENVEVLVQRQRVFTEDFTNMEMLHNTNTFNILVNSYRDVSNETWRLFYQFKNLDFEKLYLIQQTQLRRRRKAELAAIHAEMQLRSDVPLQPPAELTKILQLNSTSRFTLPTSYPEVVQTLPVHLRDDPQDPRTHIAKPIRYVITTPNRATPEVLHQLEVVKLPNANSLASENLRKYRRP